MASMWDIVLMSSPRRHRQCALLDVDGSDALDEYLLERRVGHLEAEDLVAVAEGRAKDRLRIGPRVDMELGEVRARPRDADVRQRSEPLQLAAGAR